MYASHSHRRAAPFPIPGDVREVAKADSALVERTVVFILLSATIYQLVLCFIHTNIFALSGRALVIFEFLIYAGCLGMLLTRLRLEFVAVVSLILAYLLLLTLLRTAIDPKGFRDLVIPVLFYALGRSFGSIERADKILKILTILTIVVGIFELASVDLYSRLFNVFSYYVGQGVVTITTSFNDTALSVNGIRPDGIGRSILPALLGSHRISSVFLEPVSLGNFATIIAAWGLSKGRDQWKDMLFFLACSALLITLADSRYGSIAVLILIAMRLLLKGRMNNVVIVLPFVAMVLLVLIAISPGIVYKDNLVGRLFVTGRVLARFGAGEFFGLKGFANFFGDMGYANVLTKFGIVLCIALWLGFWMLRMSDDRGVRFRAYISVYVSLILTISGTSLFALKTAGLLWFLLGCCTAPRKDSENAGWPANGAPLPNNGPGPAGSTLMGS